MTALCAPTLTATAAASPAGAPRAIRRAVRTDRVRELRLSVELQRGEQQQPHHGGAEHGRLTARDQREADEHGRGHAGRPAARDPEHGEAAEHRAGEQRHVEARHREDVVHAGPPEALVDLARQRGPLAEQEAGE